MYDVAIIGGGPSGMVAAIEAAKKGAKVILIEKNEKLGKKLYATGNGKANLTNEKMDYRDHFCSIKSDFLPFLKAAYPEKPNKFVVDYMKSIGVLTYANDRGYVYPVSNQASSVCFALIEKLKEFDVDILKNNVCEKIDIIVDKNTYIFKDCGKYQSNQKFRLEVRDLKKDTLSVIYCTNLILATGGKSYQSLGGSDAGYKLAEDLEIHISSLMPSLCKVIPVKHNIFEYASGVRANAIASIYLTEKNEDINKNHVKFSPEGKFERGELQITQKEFSGVMIFNLASNIGLQLEENDVYLEIDFAPNHTYDDLMTLYHNNPHRSLVGFLNGFLNDKLAKYFSTFEDIETIIHEIKQGKYKIESIGAFEEAQVTAGGVLLEEVSPKDFQSKKIPHLYIIGEMLDIDGICGGYNLTHAFISGYKAGSSIYD